MDALVPGLAGSALGAPPGLAAAPAAPQPAPAGQQCFLGTVQRRPEIGIPFAGTHLLIGPGGNVLASLVSAQVNLDSLVGQTVTVCGFGQGVIEGVPAVAVTAVLPRVTPGLPVPPPQLTGIFACTAGLVGQAPLFFAPSPVNATLRTASGDVLLIIQGASPEAISSLIGQFVLACGFLTVHNELVVAALMPLTQLLGTGGFAI